MAASRVSCTPTKVVADGTNKVKIAITRDSTSYTHTIHYGVGSNPSLWNQIASNVATSYEWTIPTSIWSSAADKHSVELTIRVTTKNGSTTVGTTTAKITAIDSASFAPHVYSILMTDTPAESYISNQYDVIGGLSEKAVTVKVRTKAFATLVSAPTIENGGKSTVMTQKSVTTLAGGDKDYVFTAMLTNMTSASYAVVAKDTRSWVDRASISGTYIDYSKPVVSKMKFTRPNGLSDTLSIEASGSWFGTPVGTKTNSLRIAKLEYRIKDTSSYTTLTDTLTFNVSGTSWTIPKTALSGTFDHTKEYQFRLTIADTLSSVQKETYIEQGVPIFGWNKDYIFAFNTLFLGGGERSNHTFARLTGLEYPSSVVNDNTASGILKITNAYRRGMNVMVNIAGNTASQLSANAEMRIGYLVDDTRGREFVPFMLGVDSLRFPIIGAVHGTLPAGTSHVRPLEIIIRSSETMIEVYLHNLDSIDLPENTYINGNVRYDCRY